MTDAARPVQRQVTARMYTPSGWILGTFHVPEDRPFLEFLNGAQEFFTLTNVQLRGQSQPLPFLALQRSATILILAEEDASGADETEAHQVSCLLQGGVLMGSLRLPESIRVSDHLMSKSGRFFVLRDCTVGIDDAGGRSSVEATPIALVNSSRVIGVSEM